ncbi:hypothetical protein pb186bvf_012857 [Paramecium bursaria]
MRRFILLCFSQYTTQYVGDSDRSFPYQYTQYFIVEYQEDILQRQLQL